MAIKDIPTGSLPYEVVDKLPKTGTENTIYGLKVDPEDEFSPCVDYRYHNNKWEQVDLSAQIPGFLFNDYQESVAATVAEMETTIQEQAALIQELEEEVFPVVETSFDMMITSLMMVELELYNENGELIPNQGLMTEVWDVPQELTYQNTVRKGTYYLKNEDGYALGKSNGEIQPIVVDGTGGIVDLGSVEIIMSIEGGGDGMEEEGDEF